MATVPLAILGYGCRLPGGIVDGDSCWRALAEGRDLISETPLDRFNNAAFYSRRTSATGKTTSKWGGYVDNLDSFEPECFGISPREAPNVDPQHRILLESTWEALEMAGLPPSSLAKSKTGVFVGLSTTDFSDLQRGFGQSRWLSPFTAQGGSHCIAANRLSYVLDLRGPSFAVDTACSSALVAVDRAAQSLESGECDLALAGGANVNLTPLVFVSFSIASMLSPDGRCKAFDASGNGFVRAEGGGVFVLKRLDRALADRDPIQAVLLATGTNQDGRTNGITMPNSDSQLDLLREVYRRSGIDPASVGVVEAHGTGTAVGDPAEAFALGRMFRDSRTDDRPLVVGSIKTNMGHLESASGVASLVKAIQMVRRKQVPANLHFKSPNPNIPFDELRLRVPTRLEPWPDGAAGMVGINSFGFGGANAHVVVGEPPAKTAVRRPSPGANGSQKMHRDLPLVLSGRSQAALNEMIDRWIGRLNDDDAQKSFGDLAFTATAKREHNDHRLTILAPDAASAKEALQAVKTGEPNSRAVAAQRSAAEPGVAFVFCGQGPQWHAMGRELLHSEPVFRSAMEGIDRLIQKHGGWSIIEELHKSEEASKIALTSYGQPALFAIHTALARLWESWGVVPSIVLGHSVGEIAAAHVAGLLSLEDAVRIIVHRGRCLQEYALPGGMAAVALSEEAAKEAIAEFDGALYVAAVNGPEMATIAGDADALRTLGAQWDARGLWWRPLRVQHAFHTPLVDPAEEHFRQAIGAIENGVQRCHMIATVTGKPVEDGRLNEDYWWTNIRRPVRFADAIAVAAAQGAQVFLEIGPQPVLAANIRQSVGANRHWSFPSLKRGEDERRTLLASAAGLSAVGAPVRWSAFWPDGGECVSAPSHPWNRERYWNEAGDQRVSLTSDNFHLFLGQPKPGAQPGWQSLLATVEFPWLNDHKVGARVIIPAAFYVEIGLAAATRLLRSSSCVLDGLLIHRPLVITDDIVVQTQTTTDDGSKNVQFYSRVGDSDDAWTKHFQTGFRPLTAAPPASLDFSRFDGAEEMSAEAFYAEFLAVEFPYGPAFQGVQRVRRRDYAALSEVHLPPSAAEPDAAFHAHPALLDACFQTLLAAVPTQRRDGLQTYLPERCAKVSLFQPLPDKVFSEIKLREINDVYLVADIAIYSTEGKPLATFEDFRCRAMQPPKTKDIALCFHRTGWQPKPVQPVASRTLRIERPVSALLEAGLAASAPLWHDRPDDLLAQENAAVEALARAYFAGFLESAGVQTENAADDLHSSGRLAPEFRQWFERCAAAIGSSPTTANEAAPERIRELWRNGLAVSPEMYPRLRLLELTCRSMPSLLSGEETPATFHSGAAVAELIEHCRHERVAARMGNAAVQAMIRGLVAEVSAARPLRILEVNAGFGSLSRTVLPCLPARRTEYVFADGDATAVAQAEDRFRRYGFVKYQQWRPGQEGAPEGRFDVILGVERWEPTEPAATLQQRLKPMLNPGGLLIVRELRQHGLAALMLRGPTSSAPEFEPSPAVEVASGAVAVGGDVLSVLRSPVEEAVAPTEAPDLSQAARKWLILCDADGVGERFAERLAAAGIEVVCAHPNNRFEIEGRSVHFNPNRDDFERLRSEFDFGAGPYAVANFMPLDFSEAEGTAEDVDFAESHGCHSFLNFLHAFALPPSTPPARLILMSRGARELDVHMSAGGALQAALIGFARTAATEFQPLSVHLVDGGVGDDLAELALQEAATKEAEEEVVYRGGERFVPRLESWDPRSSSLAPDGTPFEVAIGRPGDLDGIHLRELDLQPPGPGEIQIEVKIAALNFLDILRALGNLPAEGLRRIDLGDECAGVVSAVGEGVADFKVGDRVLAANLPAFRSHANNKAQFAIRIPKSISLVDGAALFVAYGTVMLALQKIARLGRGESVLIHSAAGGVGLAAVNFARTAGAKIFATVGSSAKRDLIDKYEPAGLFNSRNLSFYDDVMSAAQRRGVDVVLNSLAGQAMIRSMELLAPGGRFLEIGKRDFYDLTKVALWPLRRNASFHGIELGHYMDQNPAKSMREMQELLDLVADRRNDCPPLQARTFPAWRAGEAIRQLSVGSHIGKFVLDLSESWGQIRAKPPRIKVRPDAAYLITGAFGGVGFDLAKWLVERGARHLALLSRSGPPNDAAKTALADLRAQGVQAEDLRCDVTDPVALDECLATIRANMPPLAGVFHPAMVLDDAIIANLTPERFGKCFKPKVQGAWNLHRATKDQPLDYFVLFSSISAWFGNFGQANYAAANSALEALSHHRRALGLPSTAVAWGVIGDIGYVSGREDLAQQLNQYGLTALTAAEVRTGLEIALGSHETTSLVVRVDWPRLTRKARGGRASGWLLEELMSDGDAGTSLAGAELRSTILAAEPEQRLGMISEAIRGLAARVLGMSAAKLDVERPLASLGLDSLMGVELASLVESKLGVSVPLNAISRDVTISKLALVVLPSLGGGGQETPKSAPGRAKKLGEPTAPTLAGEGNASTVFAIHPAGGDLFIYQDLAAALGSQVRVVGVESRMLDGESPEFASLKEMADAYAKLIVAKDAKGPYRLFGFSFGGLLALETAASLQQMGESVEWIGLVEADHLRMPYVGDPTERLAGFFVDIVQHLQSSLAVLEGLPIERLRRDAPEMVRRIVTAGDDSAMVDWLLQYVPADGPKEIIADYARRVAAHISVLRDQARRKPTGTPIFNWRATKGLSAALPTEGEPLLDGETLRWLEGEHFAVMFDARAVELAEQASSLIGASRVERVTVT